MHTRLRLEDPGYYGLLEALADPSHPDNQELLEWYEGFDPEAFDLAASNALLRSPEE